jgi:hypothetical protein
VRSYFFFVFTILEWHEMYWFKKKENRCDRSQFEGVLILEHFIKVMTDVEDCDRGSVWVPEPYV